MGTRPWSCATVSRKWSCATAIPPYPPADLQLSQRQLQRAGGKFTTLTQLMCQTACGTVATFLELQQQPSDKVTEYTPHDQGSIPCRRGFLSPVTSAWDQPAFCLIPGVNQTQRETDHLITNVEVESMLCTFISSVRFHHIVRHWNNFTCIINRARDSVRQNLKVYDGSYSVLFREVERNISFRNTVNFFRIAFVFNSVG